MPDLWAHFWDHYPSLCPTLSPSNHACGAAEVLKNRRLMTQPMVHFSPAIRLVRMTRRPKLHSLRSYTQNFTKDIFKQLREFLLFLLTFFFPKNHGKTPPEVSRGPEKMIVGRLLSFWDGLFSGGMLVPGRVSNFFKIKAKVLEVKERFPEQTFFLWNIHKLKLRVMEKSLKFHHPLGVVESSESVHSEEFFDLRIFEKNRWFLSKKVRNCMVERSGRR